VSDSGLPGRVAQASLAQEACTEACSNQRGTFLTAFLYLVAASGNATGKSDLSLFQFKPKVPALLDDPSLS